ncbi:MAG: tetratricopeptide repeat protein [Chthoniobacteraceae bacterium]
MKPKPTRHATVRESANSHGYAPSRNEAVELYNAALDHLGYEGGAPIDYARAFALNAKAAELRDPDAVLAMGWFYVGGRGVPRDISRAQFWYRRSARHGDPRAMFNLGQIAYDAGDYSNARRWFERASKNGHARSFYWLGKLAWRGLGVPSDRAAALALFHRAARAHDPEAIRAWRFVSRSPHSAQFHRDSSASP